jgi:sulfur carrier protein ThiS
MTGVVVLLRNPFCPDRGREIATVSRPSSIRAWLEAQGIAEFDRPTICLRNGTPVLRAAWRDTVIGDRDVVTFVTLPQGGGGGGGGGKNPLRTVLMIAVMVAAPAIGGAIAGAIGITSTIGTSLITAAVGLAGATLVNVLVPPPKPPAPSFGGSFGSTAAPSPTYALQSQGNQARLGQPIPVIYGRHMVYPDLAATPWTEYAGNEQYLHQLHCIGQGEYDLEQVRIEDTPISSFEEVTYEIVGPGGAVTLFEADVTTAAEVAGQELKGTNELEAGSDGWIGPFAANPAGTATEAIGIDIVMPRGLYYANSSGGLDPRTISWEVEARSIDDDGLSIGSWTQLAAESVTAATNTAQRRSDRYPVANGRYEIRLRRTDAKDTDARAGHEIRWQALKAFLAGEPVFGDLTLLAVRMRATDNLSQRSSRLVNCILTRRLPVWDPVTGWSSPQPTRSIAWAFADAARSDYGAELSDARIDLAALHALDGLWQARGDRFDAVFDQGVTVWEALTRIARVGRAVPFLQGGVLRIARDEARTLPVALFGPRNIVKGSLKIQYLMPGEDTADAVTVEYFSSRIWAPDEITASLPDSAADQPAKVELFGCTDEAQAEREGLYMAAANRYRRRMVSFRTELEGLIPTYGDLIAIAHDMPRWGQGGEVVAQEDQVLVLSEPLSWSDGETHYIALRRRDGTVSGPWLVSPGADDRRVILAEALDFTPYTGASEERTHFAFGVGDAWSLRARVIAIRPRGEQVEITAVGEDARVHEADLAA